MEGFFDKFEMQMSRVPTKQWKYLFAGVAMIIAVTISYKLIRRSQIKSKEQHKEPHQIRLRLKGFTSEEKVDIFLYSKSEPSAFPYESHHTFASPGFQEVELNFTGKYYHVLELRFTEGEGLVLDPKFFFDNQEKIMTNIPQMIEPGKLYRITLS